MKLQEYYKGKEIKQAERKTKATLTSLYPEWIEAKRSDTTAESYIIRIGKDWKSHYQGQEIATIPIDEITTKYLERWLHKLAKGDDGRGIQKTKYYNITVIVRQMLEYAKKVGVIEHNPMADVEINTKKLLRTYRKKPDREEIFTREEVKKIQDFCWQELQNPDYHRKYLLAPAAVLLQLQTGMRVGELCPLRYSDIEGDYIHIQRMYRMETREVISHTKTTAGDRYIYLTEEAKKVIDFCRNKQKELHVSNTGYIFSTTAQCIHSDAIQRVYEIVWRDVIGGARRSSHKARKTYISALMDSKLNINTVRQIAGHSSEQTTLRNYTYDRSLEAEQQQKIESATKYST